MKPCPFPTSVAVARAGEMSLGQRWVDRFLPHDSMISQAFCAWYSYVAHISAFWHPSIVKLNNGTSPSISIYTIYIRLNLFLISFTKYESLIRPLPWFLERTHHNMVNSCQFTCFADSNSNLWHQIIAELWIIAASNWTFLTVFPQGDGHANAAGGRVDFGHALLSRLGETYLSWLFKTRGARIMWNSSACDDTIWYSYFLIVGMGWKHKEDRLAKPDGGYVCHTYSWW